MLDIEKELKSISQLKQRPSDALREKTRALLRTEYSHRYPAYGRRRIQTKHRHALRFAAGFAAAAAVVLALLLVLSPVPTVKAAGYYTIDINPSIILRVDSDNNVLQASAGNKDASALLDGMSLIGSPIGDALESIVRAAAQAGYFYERGHVLIAHFGDAPGLSEQQAADIVSSAAGNAVSVMLLQSSKDGFEAAEKDHKSAGTELLKSNARGLGIDDTMDMDNMISAIQEKKKQGHNTDKPSNDKPDAGSDISKPQNAGQQNDKPQGNNAGQPNGNGKADGKEAGKPSTGSGKPDIKQTGKPDIKQTGKPDETPAPKASNVPGSPKEQGKKP